MATTSNTYTQPSGSTNKLFSITFPYLEITDVDVYLNGTLQTITTQYSFANATTIEFVTAPPSGAVILLDRSTDDAALQATFFPGSSIKAADLNADFDQTLYVVQEINNKAVKKTDPLYANKTYIDTQDATKVTKAGDTMTGNLVMSGNKITSVGTPSNSADAATKLYVDNNAVIYSGSPAFTQDGTGAVTRSWSSKLKDIVSVKDFGAVGDGVTNDTAAIQAAIDYANTNSKLLVFPTASYAVTSLTTYSYSKIDGQNSTLIQISGTNPLINQTIETVYQFQTCNKYVISNLLLYRNTLTTSTIGFYSTSPALVLSNVRAEGFDVGFKLQACQFSSFYSIKCWRCNVGLYVISKAVGGGGNSNSFYDYQAVGCQVGILLSNESEFPHHSLYFRNPSTLANGVCAVATFGTTNVIFDGGANEANGEGPNSTYTIDGLTVKTSSYYFKNSSVSIINTFIAEANIAPAIICESSTVLTLAEVYGYGAVFSAGVVTCDATSYVVNGGTTNLQSSVGVSVKGAVMTAAVTSTLQLGPPIVYETTNLPNTCVSPAGGDFLDANGTASSGYGQDSTYGFYTYAIFGTNGAGRMRFNVPVAANNDLSLVSFLVRASVDTILDCRFTDSTLGATSTNLFAGRWYRVTWVCSNALISNSGMNLKTTTTGAQLDVCKFQQFSGSPNNSNTISVLNAMLAGAYNPKIKALKQFYEVTAAPTIGTWVKGDIVYNSNPTPSGNIGWVCTTSGSPGTWKTFGSISP
jgi:hypothetical protein